jgi:Protein of unknown function (DUF1592)/Protein of unknown function (DUF1588)/Protein of unknown function (DUF1587)/Protein of unknown function (DUF1585)/Protein of unknown function (DUF1595)
VTRYNAKRRLAAHAPLAAFAVAVVGCSEPPPEQAVANDWGMFARYCEDCHNDADFAANLSFQKLHPGDVAVKPEIFEKVVRKLRSGLMPPPASPRPESRQREELVVALERDLDDSAAKRGLKAGRVAPHRLNRTEYATAVEQLLGLTIDARGMLPADTSSDGFDNVAEALRVTPTHIDQYLAAARDISIEAVGQRRPEVTRADYRVKRGNQTEHVDGLPLGTRDGMLVEHVFPADGTYELNLTVSSIPGSELRGYPYGWLEYPHELFIVIDGQKVFSAPIGGDEDSRALDQRQITAVEAIKDRFRHVRVDVKAGRHTVGAAFVAHSFAEGDYLLESLVPGEGVPDVPRLYGMEIIGPYDPTGISEPTESRARIFSCYPKSTAEERPCATEILSTLARGAFRRPVDEKDLVPLMKFYDEGRKEGDFESGIQKGVMAILASTKFLYRAEPGAPPLELAPGSAYAVTDLELAWRLAFFLWSQGPDETLLKLAAGGTLHEPAVLEREVRRLFADPRSHSLVTNFAFQWLEVRRLDALDPDPRLYPTFDEDLRRAFKKEMELYVDSILRGNRSVVDLLDAKHTFVNERLARHYGIPDVRGDQFRRVELTDSSRFGLFGKGSVLMVTSYPDRTSPVLRGAWVLDTILASPPTPPPATVSTDLTPPPGDIPRSVRERLARHRTMPSCNHCHGVIDPLGQALENFDAVGEWRTKERNNGIPIDSSGTLVDGRPVNNPDELRRALTDDPTLYVRGLTERLMVFALGRGLQYYDMPVVRQIVAEAKRDNYSFASLVIGVAKSVPFRMRTAEGPAGD